MTTLTVTRGDDGKLRGLSAPDERAYRRFVHELGNLAAGDVVSFSYYFPRSGPFHRRHFAILGALFDMQERFEDPEHLRKWLEVGAGHFFMVADEHGEVIKIPDSIAYHRLDDVEFSRHHDECVKFIRSDHARRFLWPHLSAEQTYETVETLLLSFERAR